MILLDFIYKNGLDFFGSRKCLYAIHSLNLQVWNASAAGAVLLLLPTTTVSTVANGLDILPRHLHPRGYLSDRILERCLRRGGLRGCG